MGNPFKAEFGAKTTIFNFIEEEKSIQTRFSSWSRQNVWGKSIPYLEP